MLNHNLFFEAIEKDLYVVNYRYQCYSEQTNLIAIKSLHGLYLLLYFPDVMKGTMNSILNIFLTQEMRLKWRD